METWAAPKRGWYHWSRLGASTSTGRPPGALRVCTRVQVMGMRMPRPMALEKASLAAKRVAKKRTPRAASRARRAWNFCSSSGPRIFSAKRSPWRARARSTRSMRSRSMPMPAMPPDGGNGEVTGVSDIGFGIGTRNAGRQPPRTWNDTRPERGSAAPQRLLAGLHHQGLHVAHGLFPAVEHGLGHDGMADVELGDAVERRDGRD